MSTERNLRPVTTLRLAEMKSRGEKIAMLTAYEIPWPVSSTGPE